MLYEVITLRRCSVLGIRHPRAAGDEQGVQPPPVGAQNLDVQVVEVELFLAPGDTA